MQGLWQTVQAWIRSWAFPGVWLEWREADGFLSVAGCPLEGRSGRAWIGIPGLGSLHWCKPVQVAYHTANQTYWAELTLRSSALYIIRGEHRTIEEVSSGRTIQMFPKEQDVE